MLHRASSILGPLILATLVACGTPQSKFGAVSQPSEPAFTPVYPTVTPDLDSAEGYPLYREPPVRLTPGRWDSPLDTGAERDAGVQAQQSDLKKPRFTGWAAGVYVAKVPDTDKAPLYPCSKEELLLLGLPSDEPVLRTSPYWFDAPSYLPAGTFDMTYPSGGGCGPDKPLGVYREFLIDGGADFSIARTWTRYLEGNFSEDRVTTDTVSGRDAVIIPPFTPEGYGDSHIVLQDPAGGTIQLTGHDLPLSELRKIAEALVGDIA